MEEEVKEQWVKEQLDNYTAYGACVRLSADTGAEEEFDKRLMSLNRLMYTHYGDQDTHEVLTAISDVYMYVEDIKKHCFVNGEIERIIKELNKKPDTLYFLNMVFDVKGWPNEFVRLEFNMLKDRTPSTIKPENLLLSAERIIRLHRLLIDDGVIEQINTGDFIKCFDLNNKPLIRPTVMQGKGARYVCFLSIIPGMRESISNSHFNQKGYNKIKSIIYTDDCISTTHARFHKKCENMVNNGK